MDALYARSFHFSLVTALTILACRARLAVTETPVLDASCNGRFFSLCQIGSYWRICIYLYPSLGVPSFNLDLFSVAISDEPMLRGRPTE